MAGRLTYSEFKCMCHRLIAYSDAINDGWHKANSNVSESHPVEYIAKKFTETSKHCFDEEEDFLNEYELIDGQCENENDTCEKAISNVETITYEYHVVYNESYNVPVLYFFASSSNGKTLSLNEIWERIPQSYENALKDKWSFITQTEHPILGCPVFFIHPCHSAEMMESILQLELSEKNREKYLVSWLSAVGPLVGLKVPMEYFK